MHPERRAREQRAAQVARFDTVGCPAAEAPAAGPAADRPELDLGGWAAARLAVASPVACQCSKPGDSAEAVVADSVPAAGLEERLAAAVDRPAVPAAVPVYLVDSAAVAGPEAAVGEAAGPAGPMLLVQQAAPAPGPMSRASPAWKL